MKSKAKIVILIATIVLIGICFIYQIFYKKSYEILKKPFDNNVVSNSGGINIIPTLQDEIIQDTAWCGVFQLIWNDMVNEVVKKDIKFVQNQPQIVNNLNKQDFNENCISEDYYYKRFGLISLDLKKEIEEEIKQKFNEKSDLLNDIDWSESLPEEEKYLFYAILKKEFSYEREFSKLKKDKFANKYNNVKYFGIDGDTEKDVRKQVDVLYYNSKDDCAVCLNTKEGDKVLLVKGSKGNTFQEIYDYMTKNFNNYYGNKSFSDIDYLKVPEINFNVKKEYSELENQYFKASDGRKAKIEKAIQTIQMKLDKKGGLIKSEAAISMVMETALAEPEESRYFYFDDMYTIFLLESGKEKPYFAATISDISKFQ